MSCTYASRSIALSTYSEMKAQTPRLDADEGDSAGASKADVDLRPEITLDLAKDRAHDGMVGH